MTYLLAQVEIAGGSVGGKALMLREPVRRDRIVTILPSGKVRPSSTLRPLYSFPHVGRKRISEETGAARRGQLCRGPPHGFGRVQGFASTSYCHDGARHAADHYVSRRCKKFHFTVASLPPRRFEEPVEAKADAMDVDDDNSAAPMLVEPRPAEDHLQPTSSELDGDGAPATEDGVLLLPRGLFDALDDDGAAADFPSRRREAYD